MLATIQHLRWFRHYPKWFTIAGFRVCERCIKPPKRSNIRQYRWTLINATPGWR